MRLIEKVWFQGHAAKWWLVPLMLPLSILFWGVSVFRRLLFSLGIKKSIRINCPVVVVGNIGVGGNGKTPVVLFLVEQLLKQGIKVGVLSRGYGGNAPYYPYLLTEQSTAREAGDEPILIYQRCQVPVVVGADRIAAAKQLIELGCQIIISDDGLQHYRLKRDYELLVVDGNRLFGNGLLLPAGPLRETTQRLNSVDGIIVNGIKSLDGCERVNDSLIKSKTVKHFMQLNARRIVNVKSGEVIELANFIQAQPKVNALAGIGDPQRFFSYVTELGFSLNKQQGFVDHQAYQPSLFDDIDQPMYPENTEQIESDHHKIPLLMTEKDAVKCTEFAQDHWWYLPVDACFTEQSKALLITELMSLLNPTK